MTELVSAEPIVTTLDSSSLKEKIARRKTIVHEVNIDPTMIRISGEKLKLQLFAKFGLFKPKPDEIQFVSSELYYEPYLVINGKYFIDYYRKRVYNIQVDDEVKEVVLLKKKFIPKDLKSSRRSRVISLNSEERLNKESKAFMVLDGNGKEAVIDKLQSAPSSKDPKKVIKKCKIKELPKNFEVNLLRNKIARRPKDLSKIIKEVFEISERTVIYTPRFKLRYRNLKTTEEKLLILDGVTSQKI